jgi:CubicO group peptidase (beta-lactamase class C family)
MPELSISAHLRENHSRMDNVQDSVQELIDGLTSEGTEHGLQVAVYLDGELIVDAFSGVADPESGRAMDGDTLVPVFSVTKGIASTLAHIAVQRGPITYETRIAEVWPEFANNGKENITLRQALNHSAGLACMPDGVGFEELGNWELMCDHVARMKPGREPGSVAHYHAITFSWVVCEPIRRVLGARSFDAMLRREITDPLGISDGMFVGTNLDVDSRVAVLADFDPPVLDKSLPSPVPAWLDSLHVFMNRRDMQRACIPGSSGIMTARAIARHYASLVPGGVDGVELLPPDQIARATEFQNIKTVENIDSPFGLGYQRIPEHAPSGATQPAFGHGGYGGSTGFADPNRKLAVALTKNLFNKNETPGLIVSEIKRCLGF